MLSCLFPANKAWCDHVINAPEVTKTKVFNKGTCQGLIASIPLGGHTQPISAVGFKLEWKNAQKNAKKTLLQKR